MLSALSSRLIVVTASVHILEVAASLFDLKLSLEWFWNPDHLPLLVAEERGFFAAEQLNLTVIEPDDHFEPASEIRKGTLDVAVTETIHLVQDRSKLGVGEVVGFARFLHTLGGVMYRKDHGITRPRDMCKTGEKLRIQYPGAPGKGGLEIIKSMVEYDGGSCAQTELVPVNEGFYHTKALQEDKADVATLIFANFELPEANSQQLSVDFFDLKEWGVPDFCQLIFFTTPEVLQKKRVALRKLLHAIVRAVDFIKLHPIEAKRIWFSRFPTKDANEQKLMEEILDKTLLMFPASQDLSLDYWQDLEGWLRATGQIEGPNLEFDYWSNELLFDRRDKASESRIEL